MLSYRLEVAKTRWKKMIKRWPWLALLASWSSEASRSSSSSPSSSSRWDSRRENIRRNQKISQFIELGNIDLFSSISYMSTCYVNTSMCFVINPKSSKNCSLKKNYFVFGQAHISIIPIFMSIQYICVYKGSFEVNWNSPCHCPGWQNYLQKRGHKG